MDKITAKKLHEDINKALMEVGNKYGMDLTAKNLSYSDTEISFRASGIIRQTKSGKSGQEVVFEKYALFYGLSGKYGKEFTYQGDKFIIEGLNTRSKKSPILCRKKSTDQIYKFPEELVKALIK